jgi:hypothetical protein
VPRRQLDLDRHRAPVVPDDQIGLVKHRQAIRQLANDHAADRLRHVALGEAKLGL